jgi:hypothetical protein
VDHSSLATSSSHRAGGGRPHYVPIEIGANRKGVLRGGLIDLELSLTAEPDSEWTRVFEDDSSFRVRNRIRMESPRIQQDKVRISIHESDLRVAWRHVNACIDHANTVSRHLFFQRAEEASAGRFDGSVLNQR